jgi:membrane-associated PAP2 superfamily phosphatase
MHPDARHRRRTRRADLVLALTGLVLLVCFEASGADLALARLYGDASGFALREHWLTRGLLHDGGRLAATLALLVCLAWTVAGDARAMPRGQRAAWYGVLLACLVAVPALKQFSHSSCPWDLDAFGGAAAYVPHWRLGSADGGPGRCFPSGHAVAAFGFLPLWFQWRERRPRLARALLAAVLTAGALFGWAQMARGAHFASHTLWSAWLCWSIGALAARALESAASAHAVPAMHDRRRVVAADQAAGEEVGVALAFAQPVEVDAAGGVAGEGIAAAFVEQRAKAQFVGGGAGVDDGRHG